MLSASVKRVEGDANRMLRGYYASSSCSTPTCVHVPGLCLCPSQPLIIFTATSTGWPVLRPIPGSLKVWGVEFFWCCWHARFMSTQHVFKLCWLFSTACSVIPSFYTHTHTHSHTYTRTRTHTNTHTHFSSSIGQTKSSANQALSAHFIICFLPNWTQM